MEPLTFERLSPRQRTCLSMVSAHISPKQIARELSISEHTVRGYLAEAINILEATDLRHAARLYQEATQDPPQYLGGQNLRVAQGEPTEPYVDPEETVEPVPPTLEGTPPNSFHFLRGERRGNDLSSNQRLIWIVSTSILVLFLLATSAFVLDMLVHLAKELGD